MRDFKLPQKALRANPYFLDINKKDLAQKIDQARKGANIFTLYDDHLSSISKVFADCPEEHQFWLRSGKSLKNLRELFEELKIMSDAVYSHHAAKGRNDFASWVRFVFKDDKLALSLEHSQSKEGAMLAIESRAEELVSEGLMDDKAFQEEITKLKTKNTKLEEEIRQKKENLISRHKELEEREKAAVERESELQQRFRELERQERTLRMQMLKQDQQIQATRAEEHKIERQEKKEENLETVYKELDMLIESATLHITDGNLFMAKQLIPQIRFLYTQIDKNNPKKKEFWQRLEQLKAHGEAALEKK